MAKCKYPNEICVNMTLLNGVAYCDSVPCSLKGEFPKQTNADRIRAMSDEELANMLIENRCKHCTNKDGAKRCFTMWCTQGILEWLKKEVEDGKIN